MNENENADFGGLTFCEEPGFNGQSSKPNTSTTVDSGSNYTKDTPDFNVTDTSSFDTTYSTTPDTSSFDTTYSTTPDTSSYESSYTDTSSFDITYSTTTDTSDYYGSTTTESSTTSSNSSGLSLNTESVKSSGLSLNTESVESSGLRLNAASAESSSLNLNTTSTESNGLNLNTTSAESNGLNLNTASAESSSLNLNTTSAESNGLNLNTAPAETSSFSAKPENTAGPAFTAAAAVASTFTEPEPAVDPVKPYTPVPDSSANMGNSFDNFDEPFVTTSTKSGSSTISSFREYYQNECPFEFRRNINAACIALYLLIAASILIDFLLSVTPIVPFKIVLIELLILLGLTIVVHIKQNRVCAIILLVYGILNFLSCLFGPGNIWVAGLFAVSTYFANKGVSRVRYEYERYMRKN